MALLGRTRRAAARWACRFNRDANGVRAPVHGLRSGTAWSCSGAAGRTRTARGPLGLRLNGDANGVRAPVHGSSWDGVESGGEPLRTARGPLGLRLNGDANGVRASVHG